VHRLLLCLYLKPKKQLYSIIHDQGPSSSINKDTLVLLCCDTICSTEQTNDGDTQMNMKLFDDPLSLDYR
jgi:hypothetical protein